MDRERARKRQSFRNRPISRVLVFFCSISFVAAAHAQSSRPAAPPGPKYSLLRYNDDFSYLDGEPGSYREDFFDPIKNMQFRDWTLSLGGEFRLRVESRTNKFLNLENPTQDTVSLHRMFLHADLKYRDTFRIFVQGIHAASENNDGPVLATDENHLELTQAFADFRIFGSKTPWVFRAGRQELLYGAQRFVSPLGWSNTQRRFDGFKLFYESDDWNADFWYVFPVPPRAEQFDHFDDRRIFLGSYFTYKAIPDHGIDFYYFYNRNANEPVNANGNRGSLDMNTIGGRFYGNSGPWDYDAELTGQFGDFAGDSVAAWSFSTEAGITFEDIDWRPRLGVGFDIATGDTDPSDGRHQTFNHLFPLGHAYLGIMDFVARENVIAGNVNLTVRPLENVSAVAAYHMFWLEEEADGLFSPGRALLRRDLTGSSGRHIGNELDFILNWKLDDHQDLQLGYAHFWHGSFVDSTGLSDDADFIYLQYLLRF